MSEKQETVADVSAWARGLVKPGETLNNTYELLNRLADRYEAAHKRDIEAYDLINFMSPVGRAKPAPVGNGAKTHEALDRIKNTANSALTALSFGNDTSSYLWGIIRECASALAAPVRNCDRFNTLEDALSGWREVSPDESGPFDNWLFAEAKGETDGR